MSDLDVLREAAETHDPRLGTANGLQGCYAHYTDGGLSSREISASRSSFGGFESCDLGPQ
jgi:hypothetical protein